MPRRHVCVQKTRFASPDPFSVCWLSSDRGQRRARSSLTAEVVETVCVQTSPLDTREKSAQKDFNDKFIIWSNKQPRARAPHRVWSGHYFPIVLPLLFLTKKFLKKGGVRRGNKNHFQIPVAVDSLVDDSAITWRGTGEFWWGQVFAEWTWSYAGVVGRPQGGNTIFLSSFFCFVLLFRINQLLWYDMQAT